MVVLMLYVKITDSGRAIQRLWKEEWHTRFTTTPASRSPELHVIDAFHGTYKMKVYYDGNLTSTETFEVRKGQNECKIVYV